MGKDKTCIEVNLKTNLVSSTAVGQRESGAHSKPLPNAVQQKKGKNLLIADSVEVLHPKM